ncbi:MAG: M67 family metallopeptidase [Bacteroidales bacterium]|nr:M67 family metallopeptidase [Bacteroidales bacterium]
MNRFRLSIPATILDAVWNHARSERPNECCGFLAGTLADGIGTVARCLPLVNERASPIAFRTEARSVLAAFRAMRAAGQELLAIYHSHPTSAPIPSRQDLAENSYGPSIPWLIVGFAGEEVEVRVWWLDTDSYTEMVSWRA